MVPVPDENSISARLDRSKTILIGDVVSNKHRNKV